MVHGVEECVSEKPTAIRRVHFNLPAMTTTKLRIAPILSAFSLVLATVLLSSCGSDDDKTIDFSTVEVAKSVPLTGDKDSPKCVINMKVHYAADGKDSCSRKINAVLCKELFSADGADVPQSARAFADSYADNYKESMAKFYAADRGDSRKRSWYEYRYSAETSVEDGRKGIVVYTAKLDYSEGGAHGISQTIAINFEKATGRCVRLDDIFVKGAEKRLAEILQEKLEEAVDAKDLAELKDKGYLNTTDMYAPQNFILGKGDITFIYNVYEIAPYEQGITKLSVSYSDLEELLTKDFND